MSALQCFYLVLDWRGWLGQDAYIGSTVSLETSWTVCLNLYLKGVCSLTFLDTAHQSSTAAALLFCFVRQTRAHSELLLPVFFWEPVVLSTVSPNAENVKQQQRLSLLDCCFLLVKSLHAPEMISLVQCLKKNSQKARLRSLASGPVSSRMWRDLPRRMPVVRVTDLPPNVTDELALKSDWRQYDQFLIIDHTHASVWSMSVLIVGNFRECE